MSRLIGYYVHHQGDGHRQRAIAIARHTPDRFVLMGSGLGKPIPGMRTMVLDDDRPLGPKCAPSVRRRDCLHYAPLRHPGVRQRVADVANWIAAQDPCLMVVDVSVEVAMLARLMGVPTVYVRLSGPRNDSAHCQAFRSAKALLSPFHRLLEHPSTPDWVRQKTCYAPVITCASADISPVSNRILVVSGAGGGAWDAAALSSAAAALPAYEWRVIGQPIPSAPRPNNLQYRGWVENADDEIAHAGLVIGHAGDGTVNAVIAARRPFICLPQCRPYSEQVFKAQRLAELGAAITLDQMPEASEWLDIIRRAESLDRAVLRGLHANGDALDAATWLLSVADACA